MKESVVASSLAAEAYAFVRHRILRGELSMGQVISRRKVAAELGMSFLPVSEALLRLEFEGLLEAGLARARAFGFPRGKTCAGNTSSAKLWKFKLPCSSSWSLRPKTAWNCRN